MLPTASTNEIFVESHRKTCSRGQVPKLTPRVPTQCQQLRQEGSQLDMRLAMCDAEGPNVVILRPRGAGGGRLPRPGKEVLKRLPDRLLGMWGALPAGPGHCHSCVRKMLLMIGSHIIVPCLQEVGAFRWSSGSCCSWGDPTRPGSPGSWLKRTIWVWVRCSSPWSTTVMAVMAITLQNLRKI